MASTQEFQKINLSPDDVPGAYINIDDFESCSILQLKRWLSHNCKINTVSQCILFRLVTILSPLLYSPVMSSHFLTVNVNVFK